MRGGCAWSEGCGVALESWKSSCRVPGKVVVDVKVAIENGGELAIAKVKGDQVNGALTDVLVDAKDARAPEVPCSFLNPEK